MSNPYFSVSTEQLAHDLAMVVLSKNINDGGQSTACGEMYKRYVELNGMFSATIKEELLSPERKAARSIRAGYGCRTPANTMLAGVFIY